MSIEASHGFGKFKCFVDQYLLSSLLLWLKLTASNSYPEGLDLKEHSSPLKKSSLYTFIWMFWYLRAPVMRLIVGGCQAKYDLLITQLTELKHMKKSVDERKDGKIHWCLSAAMRHHRHLQTSYFNVEKIILVFPGSIGYQNTLLQTCVSVKKNRN